MYEENIKKADILIEALPYIQKFAGKTVVIKYGGNAMINDELKKHVMEDVTLLKYIGVNPIIVHGGGPDISAALDKFQIESKFINGLRVTDAQTMEVAQMVLAGKTNKEITSLLNMTGGNAIGLCGIDGKLIECEKLTEDADGNKIDIGFVGKIKKVNNHVLEMLANDQYIPVVAPVGVGENAQSYNVNADVAAAAVAKAVKAEKLIYLTDTEGVKLDGGKGERIQRATRAEIHEMIDNGIITDGMIPKTLSCVDAIDNGVKSVHILDGRVPHCLLLEIFTDMGIGTMITE